MTPRSFMRSLAVLAALLLIYGKSTTAFAAEFLDPEQAFRLRAELVSDGRIFFHWDIAKGYKLYRDRINVSVERGDARLGAPDLPEGVRFVDPSSGEKMEIFHDQLSASVKVVRATAPFRLDIQYQGCADDGLCYPPVDKFFEVDPAKPGELALVSPAASSPAPADAEVTPSASPAVAATPVVKAGGDDISLATATLEGNNLWKISVTFLLFGLLLSFTPCVLPMVPILSSIIVGEGDASRGKSFMMSVAYCLGMALVYTLLGVAAGLAGEGLAGALQKPWVLVLFSLLLFALSLSMFDLYQLQVPASIQNHLTRSTGKLKGGRFVGVFFMGSVSALIVGPCVAAPLAGTLVYISQTKDVLAGALALFSMAMGMSVPLLMIGLSAGSLLPKVGPWMIGVKNVFGLLLIAVAIWMVTPVLQPQAVLLCWGAFALLCAVFSGVFRPMGEAVTITTKFLRTFGLVMSVIGVLELVGAASGGTNPLKPLAGLHGLSASAAVEGGKLPFRRIRTIEELEREIAASDRPVMLDFFADWCVSCKEMELETFSDPNVRERLCRMTLLQVDVSGNTDDDRLLMKRFGLFGPPGIIFFNRAGTEVEGTRIVGFVKPAPFLKTLGQLP
ncbi:MAG: protein-disulfide reductase DsbD [Chlorobiaceae bacterium]|nr:protein-disulfide reductase DsbD [Chlorobiaceae bacterium]NTW73592.1 protein-disulfide reductase DsbD [Chlorobiaceae bacterium]